MYWKETDSEGVKEGERIHDGDRTINYRSFFSEESRLPVTTHVWELDPGASEGSHIHDDLEEVYYVVAGNSGRSTQASSRSRTSIHRVWFQGQREYGLRVAHIEHSSGVSICTSTGPDRVKVGELR